MAELYLFTKNLYKESSKTTKNIPRGSVLCAISPHRLRKKWLEIVCDLARPDKRHIEAYQRISGYNYICDHWTQELWNVWFHVGRSTKQYPHGGELFNIESKAQELWDSYIDAQLPGLIGKDPRGEVNAVDTYPWGVRDYKDGLIIVVNDETDHKIIKGWEKIDVADHDNKRRFKPCKRIDYETKLGLSQGTLADIYNYDKPFYPKFSNPISKDKLINQIAIGI